MRAPNHRDGVLPEEIMQIECEDERQHCIAPQSALIGRDAAVETRIQDGVAEAWTPRWAKQVIDLQKLLRVGVLRSQGCLRAFHLTPVS